MVEWWFDASSRSNFLRLAELLQQESSTAVLGAGLSIAGGLVGWEEFHRQLQIQADGRADPCIQEFSATERLSDLERIRNKLGASKYMESVRTLIDNKVNEIPSGYELACRLFTHIATTNYDNYLMANALRHQANPKIRIYPVPKQNADFTYLHGHARTALTPNDLVICDDDYQLAYDVHHGLAYSWLKEWLCAETCVFLGLSFDDPALNRVIELAATERYYYRQFPGRFHETFSQDPNWFVILPVTSSPESFATSSLRWEIAQRTMKLAQSGVKAIWYRNPWTWRHSHLTDALKELTIRLPPETEIPKEPVFLLRAEELENLGNLDDPSEQQRQRAIDLLSFSQEYRRHFFKNAASSAWFAHLKDAGLVPGIEEPVADSHGNASIALWDAAPYVKRIGTQHPELGVHFIESIETENWHALGTLLEVAQSLPAEYLETVVHRLAEIPQKQYFRVGFVEHDYAELIKHLLQVNRPDLALTLYEAMIGPVKPEGTLIETPASMTRAEELVRIGSRLASAAPRQTLKAFERAMRKAIDLDSVYLTSDWSGWRDSIGRTESDLYVVSAADVYVEGLRDSAIALAEEDIASAVDEISRLLASSISILRRVALFVASRHPEIIPNIEDSLFSEKDFYHPDTRYEQLDLLKDHFSKLSNRAQGHVLSLVRTGLSSDDEEREDPEAIQLREEFWQWKMLRAMPPDSLHDHERTWIEQEAERFEKLESWSLRGRPRAFSPKSPASSDQLREILDDEGFEALIGVLRNPSSRFDVDIWTSEDQIWNALEELLLEQPNRLLRLCEFLEPSDFDRFSSGRFLWAYSDLVRKGVEFNWEPLINLGSRFIEYSKGESLDSTGWAHDYSHLLKAGMAAHTQRIPDEHFSRAVQMSVTILSRTYTNFEDGLDGDDYSGLGFHQLNSPAGTAATSLLLALWRCLADLTDSPSETQLHSTVPKVQQLVHEYLQRSVDEDWGGMELRYAIGEYHFVITRSWPDWLQTHLSDLLPREVSARSQNARRAFFEGYLGTSHLESEILTMLRPEFELMVKPAHGAHHYGSILNHNIQERFADHITIGAVRGIEGFGVDGLLGELGNRASDEVRNRIAWFFGRELSDAKLRDGNWFDRVLKVADQYWAQRTLDLTDPEISANREASGFLFWLDDIDYPPEQIEDRLEAIIEHLDQGHEFEHIIAYLLPYAATESSVVSHLTKQMAITLANAPHYVWPPTNLKEILQVLWRSGDQTARENVRESISELLRVLQLDFRDILHSD